MRVTKFPIDEVSRVAEKESWRKEINRPIYHIHKWWAQRLGTIFRAIIIYLTNSDNDNIWHGFYNKHNLNDITILDPFMGSGTTVGEALKLGAKAVGCDINPISSFIVKQALTNVDKKAMQTAYEKLERETAPKIKEFYRTRDITTGEEIPVLYYFWVKVVLTPDGEEIPLFNNYVFSKNAYPSKKPKAHILCPNCWNVIQGRYDDKYSRCDRCGYEFDPQEGMAGRTTVIGKNGVRYAIKDLIPSDGSLLKEKMYALLAVKNNGEKVYQPIQDYDRELYKKASDELRKWNGFLPVFEVRHGYNTDQARGYNYLYWKDFYNNRQLYCLSVLLNDIMNIEDAGIREQFLCLFSSTTEFNNMFCSYKGEGTGAVRPLYSNHILKPERTPLENSIWGQKESSGCFSTLYKTRLLRAKEYLDKPFEIKLNSNGKTEKVIASNPIRANICSSWSEFTKSDTPALILNGNSAELPLPSDSVDFVITDPPYFDFIHYSELSDFFFAWLAPILKDKYGFFNTDTSGRVGEVQQTDAEKFSLLLGNVFLESKRVMKSTGKLAFSFHHSRAEGWLAISKAISDAGLFLVDTFPLHAELMASTPKAGSKEPISLDAIIICGKEKREYTVSEIQQRIDLLKIEVEISGKKINSADMFVICASQSLLKIVNDRMDTSYAKSFISKMYSRYIY